MGWVVHKFGGTSVADAGCFRRVADIVTERNGDNVAVVVSAMRGMTDQLLELIERAAKSEPVAELRAGMHERYIATVHELLAPDRADGLIAQFEHDLTDIDSVLKALSLVRSASECSRALVSGCGEIWSARLLAGFLGARLGSAADVRFLNARDVLVIEQGEMGPSVLWDESRERVAKALPSSFDGIVVITGYIAVDRAGLPATLGRNGSDYSASIFGALLRAREVTIWSDVDGVLSANPHQVPEATVIDEISYSEAMELAYFGAKIIHPKTMAPAVANNIPLRIRNTFHPDRPGTLISNPTGAAELAVKGVSGIEDVALINLEGAGLLGVPGTADRLFGALREAHVSVMLISQGSSEHSICFAVPDGSADRVRRIVERAFALELSQGLVQRVDVKRGCGILAVVGNGMAGIPGSAGRFFRTLGNAGINVKAVAQGASERNISAVISAKDMTRALRAVHGSFYLSAKTVSVGLIGPGLVGRALLDQIATSRQRLREKFNLDLRVRAIGSSKRMLLDEHCIDLDHWREALVSAPAMDIDVLVSHVQADHLPHAVLIDCTANLGVAQRYGDWLARGIHVITPNKRAHSGPMAYYNELKRLERSAHAHFLYEATVGAGLPVIQTLKDLVQTGDEIRRISGIFSGTLAYLFNVYDGTRPFSEIVRDARSLGYTEPDPRDDLSGMDVARKAVILAREAGLELELDQIEIQSLAPAALADASVDEFLERLGDFDAPMAAQIDAAAKEGQVLRYVADVDVLKGSASVGLKRFAPEHPFTNISLTDNIVQFETGRYCDNPLIVRGPGAGPEVTAAGIFADLLRLCSMLSGNGG